MAQPYTLAWVLGSSAFRFMDFGDDEKATALWQEQAELCHQQGFEELMEDGLIGRGMVMVKQGLVNEGIVSIRQGLARGKNHRPHAIALLADAYRQIGQSEEGLALIDQALTRETGCDRRCLILWLYQLKGKLLLAGDQLSRQQAEGFFRQSIDIARGQSDKNTGTRHDREPFAATRSAGSS